MKIRNDFVTNSSSSSFIIGKRDDQSVTVESVYQLIRGFYKEMYEKVDEMKKYVTAHPEIKAEYVKDGEVEYFKSDTKNYRSNAQAALRKEAQKKFGISLWDYFPVNRDWLSLETYSEYEKYWMDKMKDSTDYHVHAPFTIADFLEAKKVNWLHYRVDPKYAEYEETPEDRINYKSETLNWYYPYAEDLIPDGVIPTPEETFNSSNRKPEEIDMVFPTHACLDLLGRVCVYSECGYISDYVVKKLIEVSEFSCNHMG